MTQAAILRDARTSALQDEAYHIFRSVANSARPNSASAPRMNPNAKVQNPLRRGFSAATGSGIGRRDQRVFALDHAAGDIVGDGVDDGRNLMRFGDHDAAEAGVLHKAIDALVAAHQRHAPRRRSTAAGFALADAAIEQIDRSGICANNGSSASLRISSRATSASRRSTTTPVRSAASMRACRNASRSRIGLSPVCRSRNCARRTYRGCLSLRSAPQLIYQ